MVALETGGRWSEEAANFVEELAHARARDTTPLLRGAAALGWQRRWVRLLSTAAARSFAQSLTRPDGALLDASRDGATPALSDLLSRTDGA